ncbi:arylsulfotransferase, partial [Sutterella sp. KLE1602]|uniref:aryl-sulfate sulfotransferase n=1 Tax=Sutterella sp. KLE1602 TaxID=1574262 RepID=UPI00079254DB
WGYGQRYVKYDLMGREVFNRRLPDGYADFSHAMDPMQNGNYLVRVASSDHVRPDGKHVHTVRDVIIEVDPNGQVVDEWRLWDILDPYRDTVLKVLDQGAVCLNIDASQAGKTLSAEELARMDQNDKFGDIVGSGAGRNWVHVNSVDYDPTDDSIIISSRHQSALIKIGRDKQVKWIMGSPEGWKGDFAKKVLKPVDKNGKPITCEGSTCEGDFDWSWTQHTGWRVDSKSDKNIFYLSVFDNGDARGMEQPALPEMKYSRAVVYKIDQKKMTVEQVWEYGKERGHEWYSPVTSLTEYHEDKNSVFVYSATAGATYNFKTGAFESAPNPYINEFKWGDKEPSVEIQFESTSGYQAMPVDLKKAFGG